MADRLPKRKILFIITQSELGGAMRFIYEFTSRLPREKFTIMVVTGQEGDTTIINQLHQHGIATGILPQLRRDSSPQQDLKALWALRKLIRGFQPDTLFLNSSKAGFIGSLACRFPYRLKNQSGQPVRVIYRIGGWTFNDPWPNWKKRLWFWLEKVSARWKDIIIVNNEHDFRQAIERKIQPRQKIILIYNGIDLKKLQFLSRDEARLKLFEPIAKTAGKIFQAKLVIGTIANFYPTKGITYLLDAISQLADYPEVAWILIGTGPEKTNLKLKIENLKLSDRVFMLGQVPDAHRFLSAFDAFVLPSVKEGFPWTLLEAMAAKKAIVATPVGGVPELIKSGHNGLLVPPADPTALAKALEEVITHDHLRQELGIQAHQTVLNNFTTDKMVKAVSELLE